MKPFDLEKAKNGEPMMFRNGEMVIESHYFSKRSDSRLVVISRPTTVGGTHFMTAHNDDGKQMNDHTEYDLFMAPVVKKFWVAINKIKTRGSMARHTTAAFAEKEELLRILVDYEDESEWVIKEIEVEL